MEIYPAGEEPIDGISSRLIYDAILRHEKNLAVHYIDNWEKLVEKVTEDARSGDLILTLGAGNVTKLSREIAAKLIEKKR
jgi:UDP-N-acetylmuramate--alanine ligase